MVDIMQSHMTSFQNFHISHSVCSLNCEPFVLIHCILIFSSDSPFLKNEKQPLGGAVVVTVDSDNFQEHLDVEVLWAHTTDSMCLAYMSTQDSQAKVRSHLDLHVSDQFKLSGCQLT